MHKAATMKDNSLSQHLRNFRIEGCPIPVEYIDRYLDLGLELEIQSQLMAASASIAALPQCSIIPAERKAEWLGKMLLIEPERLAWHARRLRGIGSSEIGTFVTWKRNPDEYFAFSTPRDIIAQKLMIAAPDGGSGDTRRGNYMEATIRDMFLAKTGARSRPDVVSKMSEQVIAGHEWLVGNPDEIFDINGGINLADYKCPRQKTLEYYRKQEGIDFDYTCQLHLLKIIAEQALKDPQFKGQPKELSGMFLVALDYDQWDVDIAVQPFDQQVHDDILSIGDIVWNEFVLKGELPDARQAKEFDAESIPKEVLDAAIQLGERITSIDTLAKRAYAEAEDLKTHLRMVMSSGRIGDSTLRIAGVNVKATPIYNHKKIIELLKRNDFDVADYDPENPDHPAIAIQHLQSCNEDVSLCMTEEYAFRLSASKSGDQAEYVELCKQAARETIKSYPVLKFTGATEATEVTEAPEAKKQPTKAAKKP